MKAHFSDRPAANCTAPLRHDSVDDGFAPMELRCLRQYPVPGRPGRRHDPFAGRLGQFRADRALLGADPKPARLPECSAAAENAWGSPANIVRGPIEIPTANGGLYALEDCVFYACTHAPRTANFGAGCLVPWSASPWNTPDGLGETMRTPLSYNFDYPFAEFHYAPATTIFAPGAAPNAAIGSSMILYRAKPPGYVFLDLIPNLEWMSVRPKSLQIGNTLTAWPGDASSSIAMVDTGGGPVFLSDPAGYICQSQWPGAWRVLPGLAARKGVNA